MNVEKRLDRLRISRGWGWKDVELALGIGRTMLHYIRTGERPIGAVELFKLEKLELESGIASTLDADEIREAEQTKKDRDTWRDRAIAAEMKLAAIRSLLGDDPRPEPGVAGASSGHVTELADEIVREAAGKVRRHGSASRATQARQQEPHIVQAKGHPHHRQHQREVRSSNSQENT